jgi:hypothetical protein
MFSRRLLWLLILLAGLTFCQPAHAQKSWPVDTSGVPAPPCTTYDPVTNAITYCGPAGSPASTPAVNNSTAFGQGFFTGADPVTTINSAASFLFLDETTVVGIGNRTGAGAVANVYRSVDGGRTLTTTGTAASGAGAVNAFRNMVRSANGLYVIGTNDNPASIYTSRDLSILAEQAGNGIVGAGANTILYQAQNTLLVTEDITQGICRNTAPATGVTFPSAWACTIPPSWTGPPSAGNGVGMFNLAPSTGAGTPTGIWIGLDKATPNAHLIRSINDGVSFSAVTTLAEGLSGAAKAVICLRNTPAICLAGANGNLYRSIDSGATWAQVAAYPATFGSLGKAFLDYGNNTVVAIGSFLSVVTAPPGCIPNCSPTSGLTWARSTDAGLTWQTIFGGWGQTAGAGTDTATSAVTSPTTGRAIISLFPTAQGVPGGAVGTNTAYLFGPTIPPQGTVIFGTGSTSGVILDHGELVAAGSVQGGILLNSNNTSAATTAQTITLTGTAGFRIHVYEVSARCNTAAATNTGVTLTDGGTTTWSTGLADVPVGGATSLFHHWNPGYTAKDGATVTVVMTACSAGTSTLTIQADKF